MVHGLQVSGLEARALQDPQVAEVLRTSGFEVPDRPSLLVVGDNSVELLGGWSMRRRLASVIGWRRSRTIVRLLAAEWRARLAKSAESHGLSRRGMLGGALGGMAVGIVGWALSSHGTIAASPRAEVKVATNAEITALLATTAVQRAIRTWGPAGDVYSMTEGGTRLFVLAHPRDEVLTFVDGSPSGDADPTALSIGKATVSNAAVARYYTPGGTPLADLATSGDRPTVSPVPATAGSPDDPDAPTQAQILLFIDCCGKYVSVDCAGGCASCAGHPSAACILSCGYCAGKAAWTCAKLIFG
jgi:hypothetical protein